MENLIFYLLFSALIIFLAICLIKKSIEAKGLKESVDVFQIERMFWQRRPFKVIYPRFLEASPDKIGFIDDKAIRAYLTYEAKVAFNFEKIVYQLKPEPKPHWQKIGRNIKLIISPEKAGSFYASYIHEEVMYKSNYQKAKDFILENYGSTPLFTESAIKSLQKLIDDLGPKEEKQKAAIRFEMEKFL